MSNLVKIETSYIVDDAGELVYRVGTACKDMFFITNADIDDSDGSRPEDFVVAFNLGQAKGLQEALKTHIEQCSKES